MKAVTRSTGSRINFCVHSRSMEAALVGEEGRGLRVRGMAGEIKDEGKRLVSIAVPMVAVTLSQYLLQAVSVAMAGRLGELPLSGTAVAASVTTITGTSLHVSRVDSLDRPAFHGSSYVRIIEIK
ncbi:MATE efflux family protein 5 [Apostasia shenzhenica]|uniref:MATE efflux family protein 5 n=1 Tax=Apostasia shenzhenica TaxID=1088818 RepID=A0A2I0AVY6_9ASPA|nr:MATE efflux family protein 5 [Apostasia shenzhenica]